MFHPAFQVDRSVESPAKQNRIPLNPSFFVGPSLSFGERLLPVWLASISARLYEWLMGVGAPHPLRCNCDMGDDRQTERQNQILNRASVWIQMEREKEERSSHGLDRELDRLIKESACMYVRAHFGTRTGRNVWIDAVLIRPWTDPVLAGGDSMF